jgi:hypothetical protein
MTTQFGAETIANSSAHFNSYTPQDLLQDLKDMFRKENGDARALLFYNNNGSGGHAVTPYKLKRVGTGSSFNLYVYDSNAPGSDQQRILIDSSQNQWTDITGLNWGTGNKWCFLSRESVNFLSTPTIPSALGYKLAVWDSPQGNSNMTIYNTSYADIIITSSSGNQIGFQDSTAFSNIPDGIPIIPLTTGYQPPIGYDLLLDSYSLQINNFTDTTSYAFFLADSTIYNYRRFDADNNETDELYFSESGVEIINPDPDDKILSFETIILEDSTSEKVFVTSNVNLLAGDSIKFKEVNRNNLLLNNFGEGMNYDLHIRFASINGQDVFENISIPIGQNSGHQIVPDWNDLQNEPVKILIDFGNDGTIDDSIFVQNQATSIDDQGILLSPNSYNLAQNYPNPFNPTTTIKYSIPESGNVSLKVYDILGNEVASLVNEEKVQGVYSVTFDASRLSSGVYFYKIRAGNYFETKKMLLIK